MNSGSSTEPRRAADAGLQAWHFYLLLSMAGAIWAVVVARHTHPAALLLISAAVIGAGAAAGALHYALMGFLGLRTTPSAAVDARGRDALQSEKALVLRSLKELEFDHAMRKVSDADYAAIGSRLRARAMDLMRELDQEPAAPRDGAADDTPVPDDTEAPATAAPAGVFAQFSEPGLARPVCGVCGMENDADARFCKQCGGRIA